jgi:hypothetical protein
MRPGAATTRHLPDPVGSRQRVERRMRWRARCRCPAKVAANEERMTGRSYNAEKAINRWQVRGSSTT